MGRSMLKSGFFDPDTLTMLYQAFDETWQQLAGNYQTQAMIEDRRNRLASSIVVFADDGVRDLPRSKKSRRI
jgi:hypothetical protein